MEQRIPCAHCKGSGTCANGGNGTSCAVCARKNKLPASPNQGAAYTGIVCSVCAGHAQIEPFTVRLNQRIVPVLALMLVYVALALIFAHAGRDNFHELLAFAGTLIGSVTGFYFGGRREKSKTD